MRLRKKKDEEEDLVQDEENKQEGPLSLTLSEFSVWSGSDLPGLLSPRWDEHKKRKRQQNIEIKSSPLSKTRKKCHLRPIYVLYEQ
jgi:hypothetical protein